MMKIYHEFDDGETVSGNYDDDGYIIIYDDDTTYHGDAGIIL